MAGVQVKEGEYTTTIYGMIKNQKFHEAIQILSQELENHPKVHFL